MADDASPNIFDKFFNTEVPLPPTVGAPSTIIPSAPSHSITGDDTTPGKELGGWTKVTPNTLSPLLPGTPLNDNQPTDGPNIFDKFFQPAERQPSLAESVAVGAAGSVLPTLGAIGGGALTGALAGAAGLNPITVVGGAIAGGFAGAFLTSKAQDTALTMLPEDAQEAIAKEQTAAQKYHPTGFYLGGFLPYAITASPGGFAQKILPETATRLERILASPLVSHLVGGGIMGGLEAGQEVAAGQKPNWTNVAIATGMGIVFNEPNRIGELITGPAGDIGARLGIASRRALGLPVEEPTINAMRDTGVADTGVTEKTFQGSEQQADALRSASIAAAQIEDSIIKPKPAPDIYGIARGLDPETMNRFDELEARANSFRARIQALEYPSDDEVTAAGERRDDLQRQLDEHHADLGGYTGSKRSRQLRAQIRDAQADFAELLDRRQAYAAGQGIDTPELANLRQQLQATDYQMRDLAEARSAALRRAAEIAQTPTVAPAPFEFRPTDNADLNAILADPGLQAAISNPANINRKNNVPYMAGASNTSDITNIDQHVPLIVNIGGKVFNPAIPFTIHEQVEKRAMEMLMKRGMPREDAYTTAHHLFAEVAERQWVEAHNIDWDAYQKWADSIMPSIQHETTENLPADLYKKPYPHLEPELAKREPAKEVPPATEAEKKFVAAGAAAAGPAGAPGQLVPAAPIDIAADVTRQLMPAEQDGRLPAGYARAAGELIAARYRARAGWFKGGELGTAEDLYRAEGAEIQTLLRRTAQTAVPPAEQPVEYAQTARPGPNSPGVGVAGENRLGFAPELRVQVQKPPVLPEKPLITQATTNKNAAQQLDNVTHILGKFKNAARSVADWARMFAYAFGSTEVPVPPYAFIRDVNADGSAEKIRSLTQGQIDDANHGFEQARAMRAAYEAGELSPVTTGKLFLWSFLSRGVSPYTQESLFIDAFPGIAPWIEKAAAGDFTEADLPSYREWSSSVAPKGSGQPGAGATHNLNAFGENWLLNMAERDESGISRLQRLHDMLSDPKMTGAKIRREYMKFGEGTGIDNKVVSFTMLVAGHPDVMVIDRVQTRQLWDDGRFADINLYDGQRNEDGKVITGTALANLTYGARGLLVYEAIERALAAKIKDIYGAVGRPADASIGRYHWESWVAYSQQEASHGTLGAILEDALTARNRRNAPAIAEVQAKQGEYGAYEYGARYGRDYDNRPYFLYNVPGGGAYEFSVPAFREFLADIKKPSNGVVPSGFKVTESGNAPWSQRPEVNREALDQRAAYWADRGAAGERAGALRRAAVGQGLADVTGFAVDHREFFQTAGGLGGGGPEGQAALEPRGYFGGGEGLGRGGLAFAPVQHAADFHEAIAEAKASNPFGAAVTVYPTEDYEKMKLFLTPDHKAGVAVNGDDIISVFRHPSGQKGAVGPALAAAVAAGGRRLDAFDTILPTLYAKAGFKIVARLPFDPQYAPEGWDTETYKEHNGGHPDVVFMVYDPAHASGTGGARVATYDEGIAAQRKALAATEPERITGAAVRYKGEVYWRRLGVLNQEDFEHELRAANQNRSPEEIQAEIKNNLPEPLSYFERSWQNYGQHLSPDDVLQSEVTWGAANLAADAGTGRAEGFAAMANYLWNRMGANRYISPDLARRYMAVEEGRMRGIRALELEQVQKGAIRFVPGRRPLITLAATADASTFIHESGHDFLEQMMRDAQHALAPDQLKADAATTLKWLGVDKAQDIKTRQHERFARGFEQYVREGVAPSPGLAGVFQKFRSWLVQIYQTLKGLGHPINEDIRQVFDRLLAVEPTVIAEKPPGGPSLADIHAADADLTEPANAHAEHIRVREEIARAEREVPDNVRADIQRAAAAAGPSAGGDGRGVDLGGLTGGARTLPGAPGAAGAVAGGGPLAERPGAVGAGGGEAGAEGAPVPGAAAGPAGGSKRPQPATPVAALAPRPSDTIPGPEPRFTDKAGNIRLENLNTPEDVNPALREIAAQNQDFTYDRRGPYTAGQIMELAEAMGKEGAEALVDRWARGRAYNAEEVTALRRLFTDASMRTGQAMQKASESGSPEDIAAYAQARQRLIMIQRVVSGATAEAGRALAAFRSLKGVQRAFDDQAAMEATGRTLFQLKMEARMGKALDTPAKVARFMQAAQERSFGRMLIELWTQGLISGLATHVTYMVGNKILAIMRHGPETFAASLVGQIAQGLGREGEIIPMGEARARLAAYVRSGAAATQASMEGLRTGMTTLLPSETVHPLIPFAGDTALTMARNLTMAPVSWREAIGDVYGIFTGIRDGIVSAASLLSAGGESGAPTVGLSYSPLGYIPDIALKGVPVLPVGSAIRLPGRFIAAIHSFDRVANFRANIAGEAFRAATEEATAASAAGRPMSSSDFYQRVAHWEQNPSQEMLERSHVASSELALMGKGGPLLQAFSRLANTSVKLPFIGDLPVLKFIDPFVKIAGNVMTKAILERTPVGILAPSIRADIMGVNGSIAQDTAIGRMLVGTAMAIAFGSLAAEGYMSGSGPQDPREAARWRAAGNQPHSVRIGDMWYQVNRLGPWGMLGSLAADLYDVAHSASEGDLTKAAATLHHAFVQNILDESFMRGPADLIKAVEDPGRYGEAYIRNFASSFVPFSVALAQMDRATDPYQRDARTVIDSIRAKVPGLSETILPRRDLWGEPLPNTVGLIPGVLAIYVQKINHDPVNAAMLRLGIYPAQLERKIRNIDLTPQQYDDFQRLAGRLAKRSADALVLSPAFATWPVYVQHDMLAEQITQARESARNMMMMKYPQIPRDATLAKQAKMQNYGTAQ
jgi:hypothetical protein